MVTAEDFRSACGLFASGVTVVTRRLPDGAPYGMTVSSFTSVSLDPPLILVCIARGARFLRDLASDQSFAVNILSEEQQHLAARFADRKEDDRFGRASAAGRSGGYLCLPASAKPGKRRSFYFDRRGSADPTA